MADTPISRAVVAHTLYGERAHRGVPAPMAHFNAAPAMSYVPWEGERDERLCPGNDNTCKGYKTSTGFCAGHSKGLEES